ncbi:hypothetical protein HDK90DRAFT_280141 [Phyllosticta capitalensis]|uniref:Aminoglycoside phosphotransferase domain-containing protein n=1 Tax=Phyllosticta capitalensis TaxID=121624 RepID=A0ABR1YMX7_9PEZI
MGDLSIFSRFGLTEEHRADCHDLLRAIFPNHELTTHRYQGYCSYTVLLSFRGDTQGRKSSSNASQCKLLEVNCEASTKLQLSDDFWNQHLIVQFRPPVFALDIQVTNLATAVYGPYAPDVRQIGRVHFNSNRDHHDEKEQQQQQQHPTQTLTMTAQTRLPGLPYSALQIQHRHLSPSQLARQENLVTGFAAFLARGWLSASSTSSPLPLRPGPLHLATRSKLRLLSTELPTAALRNAARRTLEQLHLLRCLPLCLNHGDVVPGNVMVGSEGQLTGLVDWAEAEVGVWGVPLYGVEFLLGWVEKEGEEEEEGRSVGQEGGQDSNVNTAAAAAWGAGGGAQDKTAGRWRWTWTYYTAAPSLRSLFYSTLYRHLPHPLSDEQISAIGVVRDVGVLLWFGFAWDEGDIGRVVEGWRDERELVLLETFLGHGAAGGGLRGRGKL